VDLGRRKVTENTPADFALFVTGRAVEGSVLVLDSEGGSVAGTIALGRAFRQLDLITTVGETTYSAGAADLAPEATISPNASCQSMCAFLLLGGSRRYAPPEARVIVPQIWMASNADKGLDAVYSAQDHDHLEKDLGSLAAYTVDMGGGLELFDMATRVPASEPVHRLTGLEMRRIGLLTSDGPVE